jgi:acyl-CoA synthetase (AMP-forming)/AMP-acid ligase II
MPRGKVGEIWIRSPFASRDEAVTAGLVDGFLRTGDVGRLDDDGFLWLEGRVSEVINRGGLKVLPQEIEEQLCWLPGIAEACVAGVPDDRLGQVPVAWVRRVPVVSIDTPEVLAHLRTTLAGYKVPVALEVVVELPRNEIGKVLRRALVDQWLGGMRNA